MGKHFVRLVFDQTCLILFGHSVQRQHMFGHQTMFDRVWSTDIPRLDGAEARCFNLYIMTIHRISNNENSRIQIPQDNKILNKSRYFRSG